VNACIHAVLVDELLSRKRGTEGAAPTAASTAAPSLRTAAARARFARGANGAKLEGRAAAWKMQDRDAWIGWNDQQRQRNLQRIVNNGRFLILPKAMTFCYTSLSN
jgi:hypothetical protein